VALAADPGPVGRDGAGPAIKVRRKRRSCLTRDDADVMCAKCGHVLHESDAARVELLAV
jgi:ribosomal protein L37AE/L43A